MVPNVLLVALAFGATATLPTEETMTAIDGAIADRFGWEVDISGNIVLSGAFQDDSPAANAGSAYAHTTSDGGDTWVIAAKFTVSDGVSADHFGRKLSLEGSIALIASPFNANPTFAEGAVHAYTTSDGGANWIHRQKITPSDGENQDVFGIAVSVSGSLALISAYLDDDKGVDAGAAYFFSTADGGLSWMQEAKVTAADGADGDNFGASGSLDGSIGVIGANLDDDLGTDAGTAFVFTTPDGGSSWLQRQKLTSTTPADDDQFGAMVAVSGTNVAIGSPGDDSEATNAGAVFVFSTSDAGLNWSLVQKLTANDASANSLLGRWVDISSDCVLAGAYLVDAAYAFLSLDGGASWLVREKITASGGSSGDFFGFSVALDGRNAVIGAPKADGNVVESGATYFIVIPDFDETQSVTKTYSESATQTQSESQTRTATQTLSESPTQSQTRTATQTHSEPPTQSHSESPTQSQTQTHSDSATVLQTPSQSQTAVPTETPPNPGTVGDPILVDFAGHRFMGGSRGRTEYLLYRSSDDAEAITMTTGSVQGTEGGFFATGVSVSRAGCGSVQVLALTDHAADIAGDACMTSRLAHGDSGLVLIPIGHGGDAGSVLAVYPHQQGDSPAFVNLKLLGTTSAFRAGCTGMLCNEAHADIEA